MMYDQPPSYRGFTRPELRQIAAEHRAGRAQHDSQDFWRVYRDADLGDEHADAPTRGEALDLATRALLKLGVNQWRWARCESVAQSWMVTVGANRTTFRVWVAKADGSLIAQEAGV